MLAVAASAPLCTTTAIHMLRAARGSCASPPGANSVQPAAAPACRRSPMRRSPRLPAARSVEENLGLLSNDEVLAVLKDREADKQPVVSRATPSEIQVGCRCWCWCVQGAAVCWLVHVKGRRQNALVCGLGCMACC